MTLRERKDIVFQILNQLGVNNRRDDGDQVIFAFGDNVKTITSRINLSDPNVIAISSCPDFSIPSQAREKTADLIHKTNLITKIGCLEMELETGEIRFRTSVYHGTARSITGILKTYILLHFSHFGQNVYGKLKMICDNPTSKFDWDMFIS